MLGYKNRQSVKPPYNPYQGTDADNTCDQLVDFSKRYPENDTEEACSPSIKNPQLSLKSINSKGNKQLDDEVKIYCMEGTPLMASSSSSYCDLREIGIIEQSSEALVSEEQTRKDNDFSSPIFSFNNSESTKNGMNPNLIVDEIPTFSDIEKGETIKEECRNHEAEATFTKSSSPLMFSRSSSVGSLNSFEQHSIVDDRSSVSAFSNLASGMISPSEIPDSPFEVASPFISKNKNNEFIFPTNDKPLDSVLNDQTVPDEDFPEAFGDCSEDDVKVYDDEGDCLSVTNLSVLSIQTDSAHIPNSMIQSKKTLAEFTQKSFLTVKCSIDGEDGFIEKCKNLEILEEQFVLEQNLNMSSPLPNSIGINQTKKSETKYEDKGTSTSEDFHNNYEHIPSPFKDITVSNPLNNMIKKENLIPVKTYEQQYQLQQPSDYSKDNSDEEYDPFVEECISSGRPSEENGKSNVSKPPLNRFFQANESSLKLTQEKQINKKSDVKNLNLVLPRAVSNKRSFAKEKFLTYNLISQSEDQLQDIQEDLGKSDEDSDNEENVLINETIELGKLENRLSAKETKLPVIFPPNKDLGCRDNCPDGVSDDDDDDLNVMIDQVITAGKLDSKSETKILPYINPKSRSKSSNQRKLTAAEDRALFLNKYYYGNMPKDIVRTASTNAYIGIDDSTCVYRTEDTPIISPSASLSDLSTLSFAEDKVCQESFLNNSRNSEACSSDSEDDELGLLVKQCIRQGMPEVPKVNPVCAK